MAGNANSGPRKQKEWRDALMLVLKRDDAILPSGRTTLERLVTKQVNMALEGDSASLRDIADRLDGKPAQAIVGDDEHDPIRVDGLQLLLQAIDGKTRSIGN